MDIFILPPLTPRSGIMRASESGEKVFRFNAFALTIDRISSRIFFGRKVLTFGRERGKTSEAKKRWIFFNYRYFLTVLSKFEILFWFVEQLIDKRFNMRDLNIEH